MSNLPQSLQNKRIAVYGAGAMGTVLGSLLAMGGLQNVHLITRNAQHVSALHADGATVVCAADGKEWHVPVHALLPSEMQGKYDVIFLMTKQRNNAEILQTLLPYLAEDGVVCTTQNGLPEDGVASVVGKHRTLGGVATFGASYLQGGRVALTSKIEAMRMEIGGYPESADKLPLLSEILSVAGIATGNNRFVTVTDNLRGARWTKLAVNAAFSGLSAATGCTFGALAKRNKSRLVALAILRECLSVAEAEGTLLTSKRGKSLQTWLGGKSPFRRFIAYLVLPFAMRKHKKLVSGMCRDIQNHTLCEVDLINGAVCAVGERLGVPTPYNTAVVQMVRQIEKGYFSQSYVNMDYFFRLSDYLGQTL